MGSILDIFNSSFLIFLGILVLVVALLVVYFESKMREQNHKIVSMLSLVSTLAEDVQGVKMGLNHLAITQQQGGLNETYNYDQNNNLEKNKLDINSSDLIEVSDDESEESDNNYSENNSEIDEESNEESDEELSDDESEDETDDENSCDNIKVLKLSISNEGNENTNETFLEVDDNITDLDVTDFEPTELDTQEFTEISDDYAEKVLDLKYETEEEKKEDPVNLTSDLKTISINLGDDHDEHNDVIDYKKLQLPKLRSIAVEKGLTSNSDASKLKKNELLKLLGSD